MDYFRVQTPLNNLNHNQNHTYNYTKNRNNNGNRVRYKYLRVLKDLQKEISRDFCRARESGASTKQETGSGGRSGVESLTGRRFLPVKVDKAGELDRRGGL
jgi:hypothetical protein